MSPEALIGSLHAQLWSQEIVILLAGTYYSVQFVKSIYKLHLATHIKTNFLCNFNWSQEMEILLAGT